jgi:hypothetical protein
MAITRTQIAKQLLANGGRTGFFSAGLARGDDISPGTSTSGGDRRSQDRPNMRDVAGPVRPVTNPVFGDPDPEVDVPTRLRKDTGTSFLKNLNAERRANPFLTGASLINPIFGLPTLFRVAKQTGDMRKALGVQSPKPVDFSGMDRGGDVPYWAKLGYSSESEYLAALARAQAPSTTEQEPEEDEGLRLAFRAEGGPIGGEYDFESARQMYGLGKLVKKVTRTVKKIAKSPIGKAALLYTGAAGLGALGAGTGFAGFKSSLFSPSTILSNLAAGGRKLGILKTQFPGFSERVGPLSKLGIGSAILGASALAGLLTPEQEEEAQELSRGEGIDIEAARRSILNAGTAQDFRARRFVAEGGSMKEPVAKKTMPLLDLEGQEMDLRAEGGFVPIGRMEKADDVPARLSKNEFVFTADAVRNAGDGDVDKGAEVMYNMMKNLEAGGDVSEESQGLEGARKMFQTSQRLEEVL